MQISLIMTLALLLLSPALCQAQQKPTTPKHRQTRQQVEQMVAYYTAMAKLPFWKLPLTPVQLFAGAIETDEPFPPGLLDALQTALPHMTDDYAAAHTAAWLYRYGRPAGYEYLAKILRNPSDRFAYGAAVSFATNQDTRQIVPILVEMGNKKYFNEPELNLALGDWHNSQVADALWALLQKNADNPNTANILLAVANQNMTAALPLARRLYSSTDPPVYASDNTLEDKMFAGAALVKLEGLPRAADALEFMLNHVQPGPLPKPSPGDNDNVLFLRHAFIDISSQLRLTETLPKLRSFVTYYVEKGMPVQGGTTIYGTPDYELAVNAAQALARMKDKSSAPLVTRLLGKLRKNKAGGDASLLVTTADVVLDLGGSPASVGAVLGKTELACTLAKRKLKPIPGFLLPRSHYNPYYPN